MKAAATGSVTGARYNYDRVGERSIRLNYKIVAKKEEKWALFTK